MIKGKVHNRKKKDQEERLMEKRSPISFIISGRRKGMFISLTLSHRNWSECHGHQTLK